MVRPDNRESWHHVVAVVATVLFLDYLVVDEGEEGGGEADWGGRWVTSTLFGLHYQSLLTQILLTLLAKFQICHFRYQINMIIR